MTSLVAILEDNQSRIERMRSCLMQISPNLDPLFFESAHLMVAWLSEHLGEVSLISLDYDLPVRHTADGKMEDFDTGEIVAASLAAIDPTCPTIVHSSNTVGAARMYEMLETTGWPVVRVYPYEDTQWISDAWSEEVKRYIASGLLAI